MSCPTNFLHYPSLARQARVEGVVRVEFDIAKDGTVTNVAAKSGRPILQRGAVSTVNAWTFGPDKQARHQRVEFRYKLQGKEGDERCTRARIDLPIIEIIQAPPLVETDR